MSSGLTGRVETLETQISRLNQTQIRTPDVTQYNALSDLNEQRYAQLTSTLETVQEQLRTLQSAFVSFRLDFADHQALPAISGHSGLSGEA